MERFLMPSSSSSGTPLSESGCCWCESNLGSQFMTHAEAVKLGEEAMLEARLEAIPQCDALMAAGWKWEIPSLHGSEPWQWSWRAPPKRKGSKGRRFGSTNQAFMFLNKNKH